MASGTHSTTLSRVYHDYLRMASATSLNTIPSAIQHDFRHCPEELGPAPTLPCGSVVIRVHTPLKPDMIVRSIQFG